MTRAHAAPCDGKHTTGLWSGPERARAATGSAVGAPARACARTQCLFKECLIQTYPLTVTPVTATPHL